MMPYFMGEGGMNVDGNMEDVMFWLLCQTILL